MINESLYNKTVDILVQAYFNDTLKHGNCHACAVGNIVAANNNYEFQIPHLFWKNAPYGSGSWFNLVCEFGSNFLKTAKKEIKSTGYNIIELRKIENAFECANQGNSDDEWMFNGLMAVIEVLDIIHENTDTSVTATTKKKFIKQLV